MQTSKKIQFCKVKKYLDQMKNSLQYNKSKRKFKLSKTK